MLIELHVLFPSENIYLNSSKTVSGQLRVYVTTRLAGATVQIRVVYRYILFTSIVIDCYYSLILNANMIQITNFGRFG